MNTLKSRTLTFCVAWAIALTGCSGGGGFVAPLVGNLDEELAAGRIDLLSFDETSLTGSPFSRDGTTREQAAIAAVDLGVKGINAFGRNLDSFSEGSAGVSSFDSFVLVPTRSRASLELVDEMIGERHVRGTIRVEDNGRRLARLRSTGIGADLLLEQDDSPPRLTTQITGFDTIAPFGRVRFRLLNEETVDRVAETRSGRLRAEVFREDNTLLYAADAQHQGVYSGGPFALTGRDIWFASDGFWVKGQNDLAHLDSGTAVGSLLWTASDGQQASLTFDASGELSGAVTKDNEAIADLFLNREGRLVLSEPRAQSIGDPQTLATFELQVRPPAG